MYLDIEESFNSLLLCKTSAKLDLKLYLFIVMMALCFARLASKKETSCFALARACSCYSRNELYSTSCFLENSADILNNLAQASTVVVGVGHIHLIGSINKLHLVC